MSRTPLTCPHNLIEYDDGAEEYYCLECGTTDVNAPAEDWDE